VEQAKERATGNVNPQLITSETTAPARGLPRMTSRPTGKLSHVAPDGTARMVDVGGKPETARMARATGQIRMSAATLEAIVGNTIAKGDVLGVARIAGIMAAKRAAELIPLCHPLPLTDVEVTFVTDSALPGVRVEATVRTSDGPVWKWRR